MSSTISANTWIVTERVHGHHEHIVGAFDTRAQALEFMGAQDSSAELTLSKVDPVVARVPFEWGIKAPREGAGLLGVHGGDNAAATAHAAESGGELSIMLRPDWMPPQRD